MEIIADNIDIIVRNMSVQDAMCWFDGMLFDMRSYVYHTITNKMDRQQEKVLHGLCMMKDVFNKTGLTNLVDENNVRFYDDHVNNVWLILPPLKFLRKALFKKPSYKDAMERNEYGDMIKETIKSNLDKMDTPVYRVVYTVCLDTKSFKYYGVLVKNQDTRRMELLRDNIYVPLRDYVNLPSGLRNEEDSEDLGYVCNPTQIRCTINKRDMASVALVHAVLDRMDKAYVRITHTSSLGVVQYNTDSVLIRVDTRADGAGMHLVEVPVLVK